MSSEFCKWYVEVAWQRLPEQYKSAHLARHWNLFGNVENPQYPMIPIPDFTDDWRGISQIPFRMSGIVQEYSSFKKHVWHTVGFPLCRRFRPE